MRPLCVHGRTCSHVDALLYWLEYTVHKREEIKLHIRCESMVGTEVY